MRATKLAAIFCMAVVTASLAIGCARSDDYTSTETNLANVPLPKVATTKTNHAKHSRSRIVRPASPHLLPNGMPG